MERIESHNLKSGSKMSLDDLMPKLDGKFATLDDFESLETKLDKYREQTETKLGSLIQRVNP